MRDLFHDPVGWAGTMVDSWLRFAVFGVFFVSVTGFTFYVAAFQGWFAALGLALFIALFQLYLLYALRRLYLLVRRAGVGDSSVAYPALNRTGRYGAAFWSPSARPAG